MRSERNSNHMQKNTSDVLFIPTTRFKNDDCDLTRESWDEYVRSVKCSVCHNARAEWSVSRQPICIVLKTKMPRASICIAGLACRIWKSSLVQVLRSHLKESGAVVGLCKIMRQGKIEPLEEYVTVECHIQNTIEAARGQYCRHSMCKGCGRIYNNGAWECGGVLRTALDQRDIYFDSGSSPIFTQRVVNLIRDDIRFKDLKYVELDVLDKPLDGDTLPGDPGWNGILRARRLSRDQRVRLSRDDCSK